MKGRVSRYHQRINALIIAALGDGRSADGVQLLNEGEIEELAYIFSQVWFAALVGWMGELFDVKAVSDQIETAARWLLRPR